MQAQMSVVIHNSGKKEPTLSSEIQAVVDRTLGPVREELQKQSASMQQMADAMTKMAVSQARADERHSETVRAFTRVNASLDDHEARMRTAEAQISGQKVTNRIAWLLTTLGLGTVVAWAAKHFHL